VVGVCQIVAAIPLTPNYTTNEQRHTLERNDLLACWWASTQ